MCTLCVICFAFCNYQYKVLYSSWPVPDFILQVWWKIERRPWDHCYIKWLTCLVHNVDLVRNVAVISGVLPIFLHSCEMKSGSGLGMRLLYQEDVHVTLPNIVLWFFNQCSYVNTTGSGTIALFVLRSLECNCLHAASGVHLGRAQRPFFIGFNVNLTAF